MPDGDFFWNAWRTYTAFESNGVHGSRGVSVVRLDDLEDARTEPLPRLRRRRGTAELRDTESVAHVLLDGRRKAQEIALGGPHPMQRFLVGSRDTSHFKIIPVLGYTNKYVISAMTSRGGTGGNRASRGVFPTAAPSPVPIASNAKPAGRASSLFQLQSAPRLAGRALWAALFAARTDVTPSARRSMAVPWRDRPPDLAGSAITPAGLYRQKVTALGHALEHPETRTEASEALRGLIDAIVLTENQGELQIELKGNLAAMLGAAQNAKRSHVGRFE
jgi:hypothetical protein